MLGFINMLISFANLFFIYYTLKKNVKNKQFKLRIGTVIGVLCLIIVPLTFIC